MKATAALLALAACACAHTPPMDDPASLATAETAFAAHSVREDMRAAFLAHFASDGVFVRNGWTVSNDWLRDRPAPPIVLDWRPQYVAVARSGELGLSTGPWKITSKTQPDTPPAYGQFVSVWRREAGGPWKVAVDLGISNPEPSLWKEPLAAGTLAATAAVPPGEDLAAAEARFARVHAERGARAAYAAHGAPDLRHYRSGYAPATSLAAALAGPIDDGKVQWTVERAEVARSGDLGYVRGRYALAGTPPAAHGWYLRVWQRDPAGWRILLDVTNAAPKG